MSVSPLIECTPSLSSSVESNPSLNPTPPSIIIDVMAVGAFPPLSSVQEIRQFDGSVEKLSDFLTSVEGHLATYNLPLRTGGIVSGDIDEGWTFVSAAVYAANTQGYKANYDYG